MSLTDYLEEALPFSAAVFIALHGFLSSSISSFLLFLGVIKAKLNGFQWSLELISLSVDTLQGLCRASAKTLREEQVWPHTLRVFPTSSQVCTPFDI